MTADADSFGLIETLLWTREGGFHLLPEHLARLAASSKVLGFACDEARAFAALDAVVKGGATSAHLRVRLVLSKDGSIETGVTPIEPIAPTTVWRVALARARFLSQDPLLRHKTTRRDLYERELAEATARESVDEVLFLNERGEVCEGARCSVFLPQGATLLTPPISSGLLPGTLRAHLLVAGRAHESVLRLADFAGVEFAMGNSVRGLVRAKMIGV